MGRRRPRRQAPRMAPAAVDDMRGKRGEERAVETREKKEQGPGKVTAMRVARAAQHDRDRDGGDDRGGVPRGTRRPAQRLLELFNTEKLWIASTSSRPDQLRPRQPSPLRAPPSLVAGTSARRPTGHKRHRASESTTLSIKVSGPVLVLYQQPHTGLHAAHKDPNQPQC